MCVLDALLDVAVHNLQRAFLDAQAPARADKCRALSDKLHWTTTIALQVTFGTSIQLSFTTIILNPVDALDVRCALMMAGLLILIFRERKGANCRCAKSEV